MTQADNQTYSKMIVILDDHAFINCTFDECSVFYAGGPCIMEGCKWRKCAMHFIGFANNTMAVLMSLGYIKPPGAPPAPSITIN